MKCAILRRVGILLFLAVFLSGCDLNLGWTRYTNKEYGFSILLPRSWKREEKVYNSVLLAKAPPTSKTDRFQENITVVITELPPNIDLSTYFELNKDLLRQSLISMANLSESNIFAGFFAGKCLSFEGKMRDLTLKKGNRIYVITCGGQVRDYPRYKVVFNKILRSLRVK